MLIHLKKKKKDACSLNVNVIIFVIGIVKSYTLDISGNNYFSWIFDVEIHFFCNE
jgi:hypothetical protein